VEEQRGGRDEEGEVRAVTRSYFDGVHFTVHDPNRGIVSEKPK
jgi:hypothetical protein